MPVLILHRGSVSWGAFSGMTDVVLVQSMCTAERALVARRTRQCLAQMLQASQGVEYA